MDPSDGSPFPGLTFAGTLDDLEDLPLEVTVTEDWNGYGNQRVLSRANQHYPGRLSHVRFLPDPSTGEVIMIPCGKDDYGAIELRYTDTENGAFFNLRLALKRLAIQKLAGRVRVFPVTERVGADGMTYVAFNTKSTTTRPARKLKKEKVSNSTAPPKTAEVDPVEAELVETRVPAAKTVEGNQNPSNSAAASHQPE